MSMQRGLTRYDDLNIEIVSNPDGDWVRYESVREFIRKGDNIVVSKMIESIEELKTYDIEMGVGYDTTSTMVERTEPLRHRYCGDYVNSEELKEILERFK